MSYVKQIAGKNWVDMWPDDPQQITSFLRDIAQGVRDAPDDHTYDYNAAQFLALLEQKYTEGFADHPVLVAYLTAWRFFLNHDQELYPDAVVAFARGIEADPENPHFADYANTWFDVFQQQSCGLLSQPDGAKPERSRGPR